MKLENMENLFNPKKFQTSILKRSRENHVSLKTFETDIGWTDILNYRAALLLKIYYLGKF